MHPTVGRPGFAGFAIATILLSLALGLPATGRSDSPAASNHPGAGINLVPHGNLSVPAPSESGSLPPDEEISVGYTVVPVGWVPPPGAQVWIPDVVTSLPTSTGVSLLYFPHLNLSLNGSAPVVGEAAPPARFASGVTLNASAPGLLSTDGLAVLATWPYGAGEIQFRWHWVLRGPDGNVTTTPDSRWRPLVPDQFAGFVSTGGRSWSAGSPYPTCLNGTLGGRTFSLRLATVNPPAQVTVGNVLVPAGVVGRYCWNNTLSASVLPQRATFHLWETGNTTFLLDASFVQLVASPPSGGGGLSAPVAGVPAIPFVWVVGIVGGSLIGLEIFLLLAPAPLRARLRWYARPSVPTRAPDPEPPAWVR